MRATRIRAGLLVAVAGVLLGTQALVAAPAIAAESHALTTLRGTVTAEDGHGLRGIRVTAGPYEGPSPDPRAFRTVSTDARGHYVVRITAGSALYMQFEDRTDRYLTATKDRFAARPGTTHRVDRVLHRAALIAGTVRDPEGHPIRHAVVRAYAASGDRTSWSAPTDGEGHFHLRLEAGRYKVRFSAAGLPSEWYGDAATRGASPSVTATGGTTRHGIDAVLG